jgi:hypothetical protein
VRPAADSLLVGERVWRVYARPRPRGVWRLGPAPQQDDGHSSRLKAAAGTAMRQIFSRCDEIHE